MPYSIVFYIVQVVAAWLSVKFPSAQLDGVAVKALIASILWKNAALDLMNATQRDLGSC